VTRSTPWFLLVIGLAGVFLARESGRPGPLAGIDRAFFDWLTVNAGLPPESSAGIHSTVTLVEIDDSIADTPGRLPLAPLEYASFLQAVGKYDPAVVAIEPVLEWSKLPSGTAEILANQALILPKLLLAVQLGSNPESQRDPASLPAVGGVSGNPAALADFPEIVAAPGGRLLSLVAASGAINLPGLAGAPVRDLPLLFRSRDRVLPSFALQTLMLWLRLAPSEVSVKLGAHVQLGDALRLPVNRQGRALLDARLFPRVNRLNLDDLGLLATKQAEPETAAAAERMRGGIVILGRTDHAARTLQMVGGRQVSPAEVFAWSAVSLARAPSTRRAGAWWDTAIILGWMLVGWRLLRTHGNWAVLTIAGGLAVYALAALACFAMQRLWLPCSLPVGLGLIVAFLLWITPHGETVKS
jgi:CHASE2 domain-containing sensor protein